MTVNRDQMKRATCPLCKRGYSHLAQHICPEEPVISAWLAENLPSQVRPGYIITLREYEAIEGPMVGAPVLKRVYGSWEGTAARFGLKCPPAKGGRRAAMAKRGDLGGIDPASMAELHRLANELHAGSFGPSRSEYLRFASSTALTAYDLEHRFGGSWRAVLTAAGLRIGSRGEYHHAAMDRRAAHQPNQNERRGLDRGDEPYREFAGVPVLPNPRRLPGGGLAWTVR